LFSNPETFKNRFHFFANPGPIKKFSFFFPPRTCEKIFIFLTTQDLWKNVHFFDHPGPVKKCSFFWPPRTFHNISIFLPTPKL
jgi:hypothetical protein